MIAMSASVDDLFYVLFSPQNGYLAEDWDDGFGGFDDAERFEQPFNETLTVARRVMHSNDLRWVGPCLEGEEP